MHYLRALTQPHLIVTFDFSLGVRNQKRGTIATPAHHHVNY